MGVEYYIVKPSKKQIFYLGRRISYLEGISNNIKGADYASYENYQDVWLDVFENSHYFLESNYELAQLNEFFYEIFEFCDDKVYLDNDCNDNRIWKDWEEIDKTFVLESRIEKWCELIELIPHDQWVVNNHVIDEFETVKKYLKKLGES